MGENNQKTRLDSWKEIADYLVRDVRTVIRWEKDKGLPVHRIPGGKRHAVFAYREQIDAWLASGPAALNGAEPQLQPRLWWRWAVALAGLLVVVSVVAAVRYNGSQEPAQIERITISGSELVAWNSRGEEAWAYRFEQPLPRDLHPESPTHPSRLTRIVDLNGDGRNEVLTVAVWRAGQKDVDPTYSELICLSSEGKVLWKYKPDVALTFGGIEYKGPWPIFDVLVVPASPQPRIWVAASHHFWFASFVVSIDPATGHGEIQFVNSGTLYSLGYVENDQRSLLLAGGFNSEYEVGTLAVLDPAQPFAASPQTSGSRYHCESCPDGSPLRYFLFPRSEVNLLIKRALNEVYEIATRQESVKVSTKEMSEAVRAVYEFPPDFDPNRMQVVFTSNYWMEHEAYEKTGQLDHSARDCPDHAPLRVRVWSPEDGWAEKRPLQWPPAAGLPAAAQDAGKAPIKSSD